MSFNKQRSFKERWENPESVEEKNMGRDTEDLERAFYAGNVRYKEVIASLEQAPSVDESKERRRESVLNLFKGMAAQEEVNMDAVRFKIILSKAADAKNKDYGELTRAEVQEAYDGYENKDKLESNENDALQFYKECLDGWEDTPYVDQETVETLACDIEYRRAKRIGDSKERKKAMDKLKGEYQKIAAKIVEKGKRAEVQFVGIVNEWAEKQGTDHLMDAYSAMPLDDHKGKVDAEIVAGGRILNVNLKSFKDSGYSNDFNERLLDKERGKVGGTSAEITVLDSDDVQTAWRMLGEESLSKYEQGTLSKLMKNVVGSVKEGALLKALTKRKKPKNTEEIRITRRQIEEKHSGIPNLKKWGYLKEEAAMDIEAILAAKSKLKEDLKNKKVFDRLKMEL